MPYLIVLDEEALPTLYDTEAEAREEAKRLVRAFEAEHGRRPSWFIVPEEMAH